MTKTVSLHIGLPKTGTTFLQWQIEENRAYLKRNGIYVAQTGQDLAQDLDRDHNLLVFALQPERWDQFSKTIQNKLSSLWSELVAEIADCPSSDVLISSEIFSWELRTDNQIKLIKDYLKDFNVRIIYCERNPYDFISSMYGQTIKTGRANYSLEEFLREFPYFWDTRFQIERWSKVFGKKNLVLLRYEDIKGDLILENFIDKTFEEKKINFKGLKTLTSVNHNLSLSPRSLRFIEELNFNGINPKPIEIILRKASDTYASLERKLVSDSDIDLAMKRCQMIMTSYPSSISRKISGQTVANHIAVADHLNQSLYLANAELNTRTQELVENRQELATRSKLLEQTTTELDLANAELNTRTHELVEMLAAIRSWNIYKLYKIFKKLMAKYDHKT